MKSRYLLLYFLLLTFSIQPILAEPKKEIIYTNEAPEPIGPYSQAVRYGNLLFVSGQIAINPKTNEMNNSDIEEETRQVMENIKSILKSAGMEMKNILKATIYLVDLNDFKKVNDIYGEYFEKNPPAGETVQVAKLPKGARVEISVIAGK